MTELSPDDAAAYAADSAAPIEDAANILAQITREAAILRQAQADVKDAETALKNAQERARVLAEVTLPQLMIEAKQDLLKTTDGWWVERKEVLRASLSEANAPAGIMYLRAKGYGAIVKRDVSAKFGMGEDQKAAEAVDTLVGMGVAPTDKQSVHPGSLAASIREMLKEGIEVDMVLLGAHISNAVTLKPVKK